MYTKNQASQQRQAFWTAFGRYMLPVPGAEGEKVNWINYKTGIKHVYFKMDANSSNASVGIYLTHPQEYERKECFLHMLSFKELLHDTVGEEWQWREDFFDENGKNISAIYHQLSGVNVFEERCWPQIISFFKPRIIALNQYWQMVKLSFE